jgi:hypothetical protein
VRNPTTVGAIDSSNYGEKDAHDDVLSNKCTVYQMLLQHIELSLTTFSQYQVSPRATPPRGDSHTRTTSSHTPTHAFTNDDNVNFLHTNHLLPHASTLSLKPTSTSWPPFTRP